MSRDTIDQVSGTILRLMNDFPAPWCVTGGWAIDLFVGRQTRAHGIVEVAIFRDDQDRLRQHLPGWTFDQVVNRRQALDGARWRWLRDSLDVCHPGHPWAGA